MYHGHARVFCFRFSSKKKNFIDFACSTLQNIFVSFDNILLSFLYIERKMKKKIKI